MKIKSICKRSLAIVLALMMLLTSGIVSAVAANVDIVPVGATVTYTDGDVLFFNMSAVSWWTAGTNGNGNFAYFFNNSTNKNAWSAHAVQYSGSVYYVKIPAGTWEGVILTRNNTSTSPSWDNKWNQTGNIALSSTSNYISSFSENSTSATWSTQKPASNVSLTASKTSVNTGESVTLTPSLTSNTTYNEIKSTTYSVSPSSGASVSGNTFTATAAGTYTVTATITYNPKGYSSLTSTATATTTITVNQSVVAPAIPAAPTVEFNNDLGGTGTQDDPYIFTPGVNTEMVVSGVLDGADGLAYNVDYTASKVDWAVGATSSGVYTGVTAPAAGVPKEVKVHLWAYNQDGTAKEYSNGYATTTIYIQGAVPTVTATFKDENGNVLYTTEIDSGTTPVYVGDIPSKTGYTFAWNPPIGAISVDTTYTATFTPNDQTVTVTAYPTEGGTVTGGGTHKYDSVITLKADPDTLNGYTFNGWTLTGNYEFTSGSTAANETITIKVLGNVNAVANFEAHTTFNVIVNASPAAGGTAEVNFNKVIEGSSAILTATANDHYTFSGWEITGTYNQNMVNTSDPEIQVIPGSDITATAVFTPDVYNVTVNSPVEGGTASASTATVTYNGTVILTAEAESSEYSFSGWTIVGDYAVVSGSTSSAEFEIRPLDNIEVTPKFTKDQKLTIYTYSENGYNQLTLTESDGTTTNSVLTNVPQPNTETIQGTVWNKSEIQKLTNGYSNNVTATLSGGNSSETVIYVDFSNAGANWGSGHYLSVTASSNSGKQMNATTTTGAGSYVPKNDAWLGEGTHVSGSIYKWTIPSANLTDLKSYGFTVWSSNENTYDQVWAVDVSHVSYSTTYNTYTIGSSKTTHGERQADCFTLTAERNTTNQATFNLTYVLYNSDGTWKGVTEVWLYDGSTKADQITLRRDILDLIDIAKPVYDAKNDDNRWTTASWDAFVTAYNNAITKVASPSETGMNIGISTNAIPDSAYYKLNDAYYALTPQASYTVTVNQVGDRLGTVTIGTNSVTTATGELMVPQNQNATVTVTAHPGYYIESITGDITASDKATPFETTLLVNDNKEFTVTYAPNPTVDAVQPNGTGTVTVNGSGNFPVSVEYNGSAEVIVTAPDGKYITSIVAGTSVYSNDSGDESKITHTFTLSNIIDSKTIIVAYGDRNTYNVTVGAYDATQGTLYYKGEAIPAEGKVISVYAGEDVGFTATPAAHFAVSKWIVDGVDKPASTSIVIAKISKSQPVVVEFVELQDADITIKGIPNNVGTVTATYDGKTVTNKDTNNTFTVEEGTTITLNVNVDDNRYKFLSWKITGDCIKAGSLTSNEITITAKSSDVTVAAVFSQVYTRIYLKNDAGWSNPYAYVWNSSESTTSHPGDKMTYDNATGYWYIDVPSDAKNIQFNIGSSSNQTGDLTLSPGRNLYNNKDNVWNSYVETGYYLQGTWNGKEYSAYDLVQLVDNGGGYYKATISVTNIADGYIYINPTNEMSNYYNAPSSDVATSPVKLTSGGTYANHTAVKIPVDKAYDITFIFNPETGYFSWTTETYVPTITIIGTDGQEKEPSSDVDENMVSSNGHVGKTYFDAETIESAVVGTYSVTAQAKSGEPVTFLTQVNKNGKTGDAAGWDYRVEGWVINGTEFVKARNLGKGLYSGSYVFTQDMNSVIPVYFHTKEWLDANEIKTVTVYAVADKNITNWNQYFAAYTWYKESGVNKYEQFGQFGGQVLIPVTGLDNVYYTFVEYEEEGDIRISGITFNNYAPGNKDGDLFNTVVTSYSNIQTYDYYEFISLLQDGKENITFVLKDTNDTYNSNRVNGGTVDIKNGNWDFVQYTDYSGLKTDIFGNDIEAIDSTLDDTNALYVIQAGDKNYSGVGGLDGQWYVDCYLYNANGTYIGKCYSYELHDEDSAIWSSLAAYKNQRAYISYEHVNNGRYDGEWYGDAEVSATVNLAVNVALMDNNDNYTIDTDGAVNDADYGTAYISANLQNVDAVRGDVLKLNAISKPGFKFVGWYSADGTLFSSDVAPTTTAAIGTTFTAVFEELAEGYFYVNHYLYPGTGTAAYVPKAHGGNAVLYAGIDNLTKNTSTTLLKGNTAYLEATEDDRLLITIATDATGADKFYSWYVNALDAEGKTTYEEVGVDSEDNLYGNNGTVVGRNDIVYFQFEYIVGEDFDLTIFSDLIYQGVDVELVYQYTDRYEEVKEYVVKYNLSAEEIEGFAGNNWTPYTPAYITGDGWENTILKYAPYIDDYYKNAIWTINSSMYDTLTFNLWATQPYKDYTITLRQESHAFVLNKKYNETVLFDAAELFGCRSGQGFWFEDVADENGEFNGIYDSNRDKIITYNAYYSYRVTADINLGYCKTAGEIDFNISIEDPVYGREQTTDEEGNITADKVDVDYLLNIVTPNLYGDEGFKKQPVHNGQELTGNWSGAHVTIEDYETVTNSTVEYGVVVEMFGTTTKVENKDTYDQALAEAVAKGYGTDRRDAMNGENTVLGDLEKAANGQAPTDQVVYKNELIAYRSYTTKNPVTNFNRVLLTIEYKNNATNHGYFYNVYGFVKVTDNESGAVRYYFSNPETHNIYFAGTSEAVVDGNAAFE